MYEGEKAAFTFEEARSSKWTFMIFQFEEVESLMPAVPIFEYFESISKFHISLH